MGPPSYIVQARSSYVGTIISLRAPSIISQSSMTGGDAVHGPLSGKGASSTFGPASLLPEQAQVRLCSRQPFERTYCCRDDPKAYKFDYEGTTLHAPPIKL